MQPLLVCAAGRRAVALRQRTPPCSAHGRAAPWCLPARKPLGELACALSGRVVDLAADQDTTDLQKCLACASRMVAADPGRYGDAHILAIGALAPVAVGLQS